MTQNPLLLYMVADLLRNPELQGTFVDDPEQVMDSYGLTTEQRAVLYSMHAGHIGDYIRREFAVAAPLEGGVPIQPDWPLPDPQIRSFEPRTAARGATVDVVIRGEGLLPSAEVRLVPEAAEAPCAAGVVRGVRGTFREAEMQASFDLGTVSPGRYRIEVANGPDLPPLRSWKHGPFFSVQ